MINNNVYDVEHGCAAFNLFRNYRLDSGGGVLIAVKKLL